MVMVTAVTGVGATKCTECSPPWPIPSKRLSALRFPGEFMVGAAALE